VTTPLYIACRCSSCREIYQIATTITLAELTACYCRCGNRRFVVGCNRGRRMRGPKPIVRGTRKKIRGHVALRPKAHLESSNPKES